MTTAIKKRGFLSLATLILLLSATLQPAEGCVVRQPAIPSLLPAHPLPDSLPAIGWSSRTISEGVLLRTAQTRLFDSDQAVYVVDIDTTAGDFEFGVAASDKPLVTSLFAAGEGALAAVNGTFFNMNRHPRSLVGITEYGHVLFIVIDGRQPGYVDGMSLFEARELGRSLGCNDLLNLDGGGSTTLYIKGEPRDGVVNRPSGKAERRVPSILFVRER